MQRSFDDLGTPLHDVTFVVVDLETTGTAPASCAITEIGAVKLRGGECLGTFQTLVNPGGPIPPSITFLTGITEAMVVPAPPIDAVLPAFLEFVQGAVIVGHNVRFDLGFLRAALERTERPPLPNRFVDTCALARRLVADEVPNCTLATLSRHFRTAAVPCHRALDDALATGEVLHALLERAGRLGVLALDDLLELPSTAGHPQAAKLRLVARLPRQPGVYLFRDGEGRVLYVGRATDLRRRVRSYFSSDQRRKVGALLRETQTIDHTVCSSELEAAVLEVRLIHELTPRFNRQAKAWSRYAYLKVTLDERLPRLAVVRAARAGDGCLYLGPLPSTKAAHQLADAIETAAPIRRCTLPSGRDGRNAARPYTPRRQAPCTPAQLGVATCPCSGQISEDDYAAVVDTVVRGLTVEPQLVVAPLERRMRTLAAARRFEEATLMRDRAAALTRALMRQRRLDALRRAGRVVLEMGGAGAVLDRGCLVTAWSGSAPPLESAEHAGPPPDVPLPRELADELGCVAAWIDARAESVRLVRCEGELAWPLPRLPRFEPARSPARGQPGGGPSESGRPNGSAKPSSPAAPPSSPSVTSPS